MAIEAPGKHFYSLNKSSQLPVSRDVGKKIVTACHNFVRAVYRPFNRYYLQEG